MQCTCIISASWIRTLLRGSKLPSSHCHWLALQDTLTSSKVSASNTSNVSWLRTSQLCIVWLSLSAKVHAKCSNISPAVARQQGAIVGRTDLFPLSSQRQGRVSRDSHEISPASELWLLLGPCQSGSLYPPETLHTCLSHAVWIDRHYHGASKIL